MNISIPNGFKVILDDHALSGLDFEACYLANKIAEFNYNLSTYNEGGASSG